MVNAYLLQGTPLREDPETRPFVSIAEGWGCDVMEKAREASASAQLFELFTRLRSRHQSHNLTIFKASCKN